MSALSSFKKLTPLAQRGFISRVQAGLVDEPADFSRMVDLYESQQPRKPTRPGWTEVEEDMYQARVRAGLSGPKREAEERRETIRESERAAAVALIPGRGIDHETRTRTRFRLSVSSSRPPGRGQWRLYFNSGC